MSVLIRGMKMPRTCTVCEWIDYLHPNAYCRREQTTVNIETAKTSRPEWCPLIAVPTPHGRLIDADALNTYDVSPIYEFCVMGVTEEDIGLAETIIEAEGET